MKKVLVILAHPDEKSFNAAIAARCAEALARNGYGAVVHDLYREGFDPILPASEIPLDAPVDPVIERHCHELVEASGLVIVHPNWWGMPPAILTGWVDRVFRPGVAYRFREGDAGEGIPIGLLADKSALVFNTSNTAPEREMAVFGDPLEAFWRTSIFDFCGITQHYRRTFSVVVTSTEARREIWLAEATATVNRYFPKE
jgi:NAD(P)H dehydrogenase (quinone)